MRLRLFLNLLVVFFQFSVKHIDQTCTNKEKLGESSKKKIPYEKIQVGGRVKKWEFPQKFRSKCNFFGCTGSIQYRTGSIEGSKYALALEEVHIFTGKKSANQSAAYAPRQRDSRAITKCNQTPCYFQVIVSYPSQNLKFCSGVTSSPDLYFFIWNFFLTRFT